jgi:pimeloyl-ACP methyl ester carboxylesterase
MSMSISVVDAAGIPIRVYREGDGPSVALLHGIDGLDGLLPFAHELSRFAHVIAPEIPGFGGSERPSWIRSIRDVASLFHGLLLSTLAGKASIVVGHCLGGWIAAEYAATHPERVSGLGLISSFGFHWPTSSTTDVFVLSAERLLETAYSDQNAAPDPPDETSIDYIRMREALAQYGWSPRLFDPTLLDRLSRFESRTALLWGSADVITPREHGQLVRDALSNSSLRVLPNIGHNPHREALELLVEEMSELIHEAAGQEFT